MRTQKQILVSAIDLPKANELIPQKSTPAVLMRPEQTKNSILFATRISLLLPLSIVQIHTLTAQTKLLIKNSILFLT